MTLIVVTKELRGKAMEYRAPKLLITCPHGKEERAIEEVMNILLLQDINAKCELTPYPGVVLVYTKLSSRSAFLKIKNSPTSYIFRVVPLDVCVETSLENIVEASLKLARCKVHKNVRFHVDCIRRGRYVSSSVLVERTVGKEIVEKLGGIVDLKKPDYIVRIEVIGVISCISILKPDEIIVKRAKPR